MRKYFRMLCLLLGFSSGAFAGGTDFSGEWMLVNENGIIHEISAGANTPDVDSRMLIAHNGNKLVVERQLKCDNCSNSIREYVIDGKTRKLSSDSNRESTYSAEWDGSALVIKQGFGGATPFGQVAIQARQVWALSADKQVLSIATSSNSATGETTVMQVYKRSE